MSDVGCVDVCDFFFFQAEDGIRDAQESRGLGDVYKRQVILRLADEGNRTLWMRLSPCSSLLRTEMLFSLIHTETGSSSRFRHFAFEAHRLIQSLFGYFHHNPSLMEARSDHPAKKKADCRAPFQLSRL